MAWVAWLFSGILLVWLGRLAGFDQDAGRRLLILYATSPILLAYGHGSYHGYLVIVFHVISVVRLRRSCIVVPTSKRNYGGW